LQAGRSIITGPRILIPNTDGSKLACVTVAQQQCGERSMAAEEDRATGEVNDQTAAHVPLRPFDDGLFHLAGGRR
jgi:hypothetical protein